LSEKDEAALISDVSSNMPHLKTARNSEIKPVVKLLSLLNF
jgi:hypothetical protein